MVDRHGAGQYCLPNILLKGLGTVGKFGFDNSMKQADAMLEAYVPATDHDRWLALARSLVERTPDISDPGPAVNNGVHFWISKNGKWLNGLQIWVSRVWEDKDKGKGKPVGQRSVYVEWDEAAIDGVGPNGNDEGLGSLIKMFRGARKGVPGFEIYRDFLKAYGAEIQKVEPSAQLKFNLPKP